MGAPIHQSLVNPILIAGMEWRLAVSLFIIAGALIFGPGFHVYTLAEAGILLTVGPYALGKLAQYDAQFEDVLLRYWNYDRVYDAESPPPPKVHFWQSTIALAGRQRPAVPTPKEI
jgi:type IV secretory pathway TrbD component